MAQVNSEGSQWSNETQSLADAISPDVPPDVFLDIRRAFEIAIQDPKYNQRGGEWTLGDSDRLPL